MIAGYHLLQVFNRLASGVVCFIAVANDLMESFDDLDFLGGFLHGLLLHVVEHRTFLRQVLGFLGERDDKCNQSSNTRQQQTDGIGRHGSIKYNLSYCRSFGVQRHECQQRIPCHDNRHFYGRPHGRCFVCNEIQCFCHPKTFLPCGCNDQSGRISRHGYAQSDEGSFVLYGEPNSIEQRLCHESGG